MNSIKRFSLALAFAAVVAAPALAAAPSFPAFSSVTISREAAPKKAPPPVAQRAPAQAARAARPEPLSDAEWNSYARRFPAWLAEFKTRARDAGISEPTIQAAFRNMQPLRDVLETDRNQAEATQPFSQYRRNRVSPSMIAYGRQMMAQYSQALRDTEERYRVPASVIVAAWGMESSFGRITGSYNVPQALATLAADGRRGEYFASELIRALQIIDAGNIDPAAMRGSWAGAMGHCQFMPKAFLEQAADGDGDGHIDIWTNNHLRDVFASTANKLIMDGYRPGETWGREVALPPGFDAAYVDNRTVRSFADFKNLGIRFADGSALPDSAAGVTLVGPRPKGWETPYTGGQVYLMTDNYKAFLKWNNSSAFATALGLLADAIAAPGGPS